MAEALDPQGVDCPACGVPATVPCQHGPGRPMWGYHHRRIIAAQALRDGTADGMIDTQDHTTEETA